MSKIEVSKVLTPSIDRFKRRMDVKGTTWSDDVAELVIGVVEDLAVSLNKEDTVEGTEAHGYHFKTSSNKLVCLAEIARDVTRSNPIVEVVQQGKNFKDCHYLLVHASIFNKLKVMEPHKSAMKGINLGGTMPGIVTPTVVVLHITGRKSTFSEILGSLKRIQEFPLSSIGEEPCTIVVRSR